EQACGLTHYKLTIFLGTLAAAYAETGRFADAVATAETACTAATPKGEQALLGKNQQILQPYPPPSPTTNPQQDKERETANQRSDLTKPSFSRPTQAQVHFRD